ncbi:MAG: GNAT family N-acetyltransferase [Chloroflexota bacterium]
MNGYNQSARPYGLVENVVTHPYFRKQGIGRGILRHALDAAWNTHCYKVTLLTGSKSDATLRFYEDAGFQKDIKTGFIAYRES